MSDEERDTTDDSSSKTESLHDIYGEKCPCCGIYKIMAESRLFEVPWNRRDLFEGREYDSYTAEYFHSGRFPPLHLPNKGCQFCGLLIDATNAWRKEQGTDVLGYGGQWTLKLRDGQFLIELAGCMSIFRGTGMCFICCAKFTVQEKIGSQSQWNICEDPLCISGDTSSPEAVATARRWLATCKDRHERCKLGSHAQKAPKRILELDGKQVRLCENLEPAVAYACLSHCWGPRGPAMQLRLDTIAKLKAGIPLETLPKTFRDAAWFCWRLGIHYIWIDALCKLIVP